MRWLSLLLVLSCQLTFAKDRASASFSAPPPGATIPVYLKKTLQSGRSRPGEMITASLAQRVPISASEYLPAKAEMVGHIVSAGPASLSLQFAELRWKGKTLNIRVKLVAAASSYDTYQTELPVGGTDRGTSDPADWTTRQIGGDDVYLSSGSGKVYNRMSQPVGHADFSGVYADPSAAYPLPRAVGPFSTTATGLHGLPDLAIESDGVDSGPITLEASKPRWKINEGAALLLEVVR